MDDRKWSHRDRLLSAGTSENGGMRNCVGSVGRGCAMAGTSRKIPREELSPNVKGDD